MKKKLLASIIACLLVISLSACGNADTPADQPVVAEGSSEEIPTEPEVTVTGTEYVFENNTHSLVTNYSDRTTETADAEDCTFGESGICIVCGGTIIIPEPVVTEYEEPVAYVVSGIVSEYSKDSVYSQSSEIGSSEEPTIIIIVGTTENGWLVLEDGSFVKSEDAVERTAYEEENGKIYTVTYFDETMELFCQEHSNIRIKPENDAEVAYAKNTNDKVTVVGICNEAEWYLLDDGNWTLKSNLGDNEVVVAPAPANSSPANHGYNIDPVLFPELIDFLNENANEKLDITYFTKDFYGNPIDPFYEVWRNDEDQFCFYPDGAITYVHWTGPGEGYGYAIAYPCR